LDVAPEQCAKLFQAIDPDNTRVASVASVIEFLKSELLTLPKSPGRKRSTTGKSSETQQSIDDARLNASGEAPIRPNKPRPSSAKPASTSSSIDKSTTGGTPSIATLHSKSSGAMKADNTADDEDAKPSGKASEAKEETDWSKVPLPEGWELKRIGANRRLVYLNRELEEVRWQHPLDPTEPKSKKKKAAAAGGAEGKAGLSKTLDSATRNTKHQEEQHEDDDEEDVVEVKKGKSTGSHSLAQTLPNPKTKSNAKSNQKEAETEASSAHESYGGDEADDET